MLPSFNLVILFPLAPASVISTSPESDSLRLLLAEAGPVGMGFELGLKDVLAAGERYDLE